MGKQIKTALPAMSGEVMGESTWDALIEDFDKSYVPGSADHLSDKWDSMYERSSQRYGSPIPSPEQKGADWSRWKSYVLEWKQEHEGEGLANPKATRDKDILISMLLNAWFEGIEIPVYFVDKTGNLQLKRISRPAYKPKRPQLGLDPETERWLPEDVSSTERMYSEAWLRSNCKFTKS